MLHIVFFFRPANDKQLEWRTLVPGLFEQTSDDEEASLKAQEVGSPEIILRLSCSKYQLPEER